MSVLLILWVNATPIRKLMKDATFMRMKEDAMKNSQLKPSYNIQIVTGNQFITNYTVYPRSTDTLTLIPFLESFEKRYSKQSNVVVADSGHGSEQNYEYQFRHNLIPYVKYNMFHQEQKRKSDAGYISLVSTYRATKCVRCSVRGFVTKQWVADR